MIANFTPCASHGWIFCFAFRATAMNCGIRNAIHRPRRGLVANPESVPATIALMPRPEFPEPLPRADDMRGVAAAIRALCRYNFLKVKH